MLNGEATLNGYFAELDGTDIDFRSLKFSATAENALSLRVRSDQSEPR